MWAMHKVHDDNFKPGKRDNDSTYEISNGQSKSTSKKVSFASVEDNEENEAAMEHQQLDEEGPDLNQDPKDVCVLAERAHTRSD